MERTAADGSKTSQTLTVIPDDTPPWTESGPMAECPSSDALDVPGLGLCYAIRPHIAAVAPGSPAARAGLKAGDVISAVTIAPPRFVEVAKVKGSKTETSRAKARDDHFRRGIASMDQGVLDPPVQLGHDRLDGREQGLQTDRDQGRAR